MAQIHTPAAPHRAAPIEVTELTGEQADELLISEFGALALVPIEEDSLKAKVRRVFGGQARDVKRGEE
jgi:hypothetical protein